LISRIESLPDRLSKQVQTKMNKFDNLLTKQTDKALSRLIKQEEQLKKQVAKTDALAANNIFTKGIDSLKHLKAAITSKVTKLASPKILTGEYFPYMDTLKNKLAFLQKGVPSLDANLKAPSQITDALSQVKSLEAKLQYSEKIKGYLAERQQVLRQQLMHYVGYDKMKKELDNMGKEVYYYKQQIKEYKEILSDPSRIEEEATKLLRKLPAFQSFMEKNGALAAIFASQNTTNLQGLQTRDMVKKLMKDQMSLLGPGSDNIIQQQLQEAKLEMDKLKQQVTGQGDATIPGFKPNGQKTKSLWQHIEIGTDIQSTRGNSLLPSTSDFGLSIAYHITKNGMIGIGGSWIMGMGKDILHVHITHEGMGLRSFLEYAIIKGFAIRGGWESNFLLKQVSTENLILMKKPENWQQSALIGVSKKMAIPLKLPVLNKKSAAGSVQLLYDFLHESHTPTTPALQLRVGMGL